MHTQTEDALQLSQVQVISKAEIPFQKFTDHSGILQQFQHHAILKEFLPSPTKIAFSWLSLKPREELLTSAQHFAEVLLVYKGRAKLSSNIARGIAAGDALLIPPQCSYGIKDVCEAGLQALRLVFPKKNVDAETSGKFPAFALNYAGLVAHNKSLLAEVIANPYFTLLRENALDNPKARQVFLDNIQVFSDFFQHMLFIRQATCLDPAFEAIFLEHLQEEFGHDKLLAARKIKHKSHDVILQATSMWFCQQMFILDNLEKTALVHLVLEVSGAYYHNLAKDKLGIDVESDYYEIHTQVDDIHAEMGEKLLQGHHPEVYKRLHNVIFKGWHMLDAMTRRVAELVARV